MTALADRQKEFCSVLMTGAPAWELTGLPMRSAAAIGGNATQESLCQPVTVGAKDHGSDGALQWRLERLTGPDGLQTWCSAHRLPWNALNSQALFTLYELSRPPYAALRADMAAGTKSLETLTLNWCDQFERPSVAGREADQRIRYAHDCLAILMRDAPVVVTTAPAPMPIPVPQTQGIPLMNPALIALLEQLAVAFAPVIEKAVGGLVTSLLTHVAPPGTVIPPPAPVKAPTAPALPIIDPAMIEKIVADILAKQPKPA